MFDGFDQSVSLSALCQKASLSLAPFSFPLDIVEIHSLRFEQDFLDRFGKLRAKKTRVSNPSSDYGWVASAEWK